MLLDMKIVGLDLIAELVHSQLLSYKGLGNCFYKPARISGQPNVLPTMSQPSFCAHRARSTYLATITAIVYLLMLIQSIPQPCM